MKKLVTFLIASLMFITLSFSQTTIFEDDFESFSNGDYVAENDVSGYWTTWSGGTGGAEDAVISTDQNHTTSGANSMLVSGTNDMIVLLGNKASGAYEINFWYYIESGFAGYFNFQHFEAPGNEWAVEVYFGDTGTGKVVQSGDHSFSYNQDQWVLITTTVDLDADAATMTIDGTLIHSWPFSQKADGTPGTLQLGSINIFAGAETGQTPKYYVDDVEYIETVAGSDPPEVELDITEITTDGTADETFNISNIGDQDLDFYVYATYPEGSVKYSENKTTSVLLSNNGTKGRDEVITHTFGDLISGVGYDNPNTVKAACYFSADVVEEFIGMELTSVVVGIWNLPSASSTSMIVWERESTTVPGPGAIIEEVDFTPAGEESLNTVTLSTPIYLDGNPIWFGYKCDDTGVDNYPIGVDGGPAISDVNWLSIGPGWNEMSADANIYVVGNLVGSAVIKWLSLSPMNGTVVGGSSEEITAGFDLTGLETGTYLADIVVATNDVTNEYVEIPVTLNVTVIGVDDINKSGIMTYPNPATDIFTIVSDTEINNVKIMDISGKLIKEVEPNSNSYKFNMSELSKGIYIFNIKTVNQTITRKIIVE